MCERRGKPYVALKLIPHNNQNRVLLSHDVATIQRDSVRDSDVADGRHGNPPKELQFKPFFKDALIDGTFTNAYSETYPFALTTCKRQLYARLKPKDPAGCYRGPLLLHHHDEQKAL